MNHIHSGPATVISLIQTNLKDRYESGFPVLKELIQNADDAGAKILRLGWAGPQRAPSGHPLLSGAALFAVNDGPFDNDDARAIYEVGLSSKSGDAATIGKFGLGMKSVFHFSEAVYYFAACNQLDGGKTLGQLNPWCAPGLRVPASREGWGEFGAADRDWLCERLGDLLPSPQHFLLWMPLRLKCHHDRQNPPLIVANFDDYRGPEGRAEDRIFVPGYVDQLATLLPMLHDLEKVEVWRLDTDGPARRVASVVLDGGEVSRCLRPVQMEPGQRCSLRGGVNADGETPRAHIFGGRTLLLDTPTVHALSESEYWPSGPRVEDDTFVWRKEKAPPHVGVCWLRRPANGAAQLDYSWAVYLPLSEEINKIALGGMWSYSLLMHGWFFVDAGRKLFRVGSEQPGCPTDESSLRRQWNRELMTSGTLPLLPESLLELQGRAEVSPEEMRELVAGLTSTELFSKNRSAICSAKQWGYRWRRVGAKWELIEPSAHLVRIPGPKADVNPVEALPALDKIAERLALIPSGWPAIASVEPSSDWPEGDLASVLASADPDSLFAETGRLEYVVAFCDEAQPKDGHIVALLRRLLARPLKELAERAPLIGRLAKRLRASQRLAVPIKDDPAGRELWKKLEGLPLGVLLLPQVCEPANDSSMATLSIDDAAQILQSIALAPNEQATAAADELRSQITQLVLQRCDVSRRRDLLQRCAGLRLFRVFEAGDEKEHAALLRWDDLETRWKQAVLFKRQLTLRSGAFALRKMLPQEPITLVSEGLGDLLFGLNMVAVCDADACATVVLRQTDPDALADVGRRNDLLDYFLKAPVPGDVPIFRQAVAIVLHGRLPAPMGQPALLVNAGASEPIWARITRDVLSQQDESWRLVDHGLSSRVPENRWGEFGLSAVDRSSVIHLLEEQVSRDGKDGVVLNLSAGQREELAGALYLANKLPLLKRLRIHAEYVNDKPHENDPLHAITDRCYWHDTFALSPEIRSHVMLLRLSDNASLQAVQMQLAEVWNARAAVEVIFTRLNPADHWQLVMGALVTGKDWSPQLIERLQNTPWLARAEGGVAVRPCDVIFLESIRDTVSRVLAAATTKDFVDYQTLNDHVRKDENLAFLGKKLFPANRPALEMLGEVLGEESAFHVGVTEGLSLQTGLTRFRAVFANAPDGVMPAAPIISEVMRRFTWDECVNGLLKPLRKPLPVERLTNILAFLARRHEENQGSSEHRAQVLEIYGWYLRELTSHGEGFRNALTGVTPVRLLSGAGRWKTGAELCLGAENIDADHRLATEHRDIVEPYLVETAKDAPAVVRGSSISSTTGDHVKAAEELKAYFKPWLEYRPALQVIIGGFLAIIGGNPTVKQLAQHYLGKNYKVANVRQRLRLPKDQFGRTGEGQVDQFVVIVQRERGQQVAVNNLCGQGINVRLSKEIEDLFVYHSPVSPFERKTASDGDTRSFRVVRLRDFAPSTVGDQRLITLLRKAAGKIVAEFYNQALGTGLDDLFKGLKEDDIHQIRVAETYLMDHAPASLRQFDLTSQPRLRELLRQMDEVHRLRVEEDRAVDEGAIIERHSDEQRRQVQQDFREALNDPAVCAVLLEAVRRKINGHFQYSESSVPFELLQNADDACIEFEQLGGVPGNWFSIACNERSLAFLHAGRPINVAGTGEAAQTDAGFHRDLEKMLMLSTSDKQTGAETSTVTGKFGLGYKSVFLISDTPRSLSSGLGFSVVGALLPFPLAGEDRQELEDLYKTITGRDIRDAQGTIFYQPLRKEATTEMILSRFRRVLAVQLVFTQRVRKCHVHGLFPEPKTTEWNEQSVPHASGWAVGVLDSPDPDSLLNRHLAAVVRLADKKALLLGLDRNGFTALPDEIPSLWVTAPTGHEEKVGIAVNAPFAVDVGRAQLARDSSAHEELADELGIAIGAAFVRLFDAAHDCWDEVRKALGISDSSQTTTVLWRSLWHIVGEKMANRARHSDSEAFKLLQKIFWGKTNCGVAHLYEERAAVPTGLSGDHDVLTKRSLITKRLAGCLDDVKGEGLFKLATKWPRVRSQLIPGRVVSDSRVWAALRTLGAVDERQASLADLSYMLDWELTADSLVTPARAAAFGLVVTAALLQRLENDSAGMPEANRIRAALKLARFVSRSNSESSAEQLLIPSTNDSDRVDETRRAGFAPENCILADEYEGTAKEFFLACRGALKSRVDDLIKWGRAAKGGQRAKFLEYLHDGELSSTLSRALRQQTVDTDWWRNAEAFKNAAGKTQGIDTGFVGAIVGQERSDLPFNGTTPDLWQTLDPNDVLPRVAEWWQNNRDEWMRRYCNWVYPNSLRVLLGPRQTLSLSMDDLSTDCQGRKRWLSLFVLGMTHGLGRGGQQAQQHKGFLELCEQQKWLDVFADPNVNERRADWMALVDSYLEKQQGDPEYYNWLRQLFISIRAVAVRLADYAEAFRALRGKGEVRLSDVLRPRTSVKFQGGGVDPPSLARVLSLGACFVVRELVRGGFIPLERAKVHRFCYPPVGSVRRLLGTLAGCPDLEGANPDSWTRSELIYDFLGRHLSDPTFGGDFDIPLWLVSRRPELQEEILGTSEGIQSEARDDWE